MLIIENSVEVIGNMLVHPVTREIVKEDNFTMFVDWKTAPLMKAENCKETITEAGVTLTGVVNGVEFETVQGLEEYFEGKSFFLQDNVTETEIINEIESLSSEVQVIKNNAISSLYKVLVNGKQLFGYRVKNEIVTIFPYWNYFSNTKIYETDLEGLFDLAAEKTNKFNLVGGKSL